jgi:hypothetical protein
MSSYKSLIRDGEPDKFINALISMKANFETYSSNYALKIIYGETIFNFTKHEMSQRAFSGAAKVKHDLMNFPVPELDFSDVHYFQHDFKEPVYVERVSNIDLKSAYAYILFMDDLISPATFKYLKSMHKKDRLQAIGMIASRKEVHEYKRGQVMGVHTERSSLSGFFFYAVKRTFEIMSELKKICGKNYLYTWVDGIYFLPEPGLMEKLEDYLKGIKFPYSKEELSEFEVKFLSGGIKVSFRKNDDNKIKEFDLPFEDSVYKKLLMKMIFQQQKQKQVR